MKLPRKFTDNLGSNEVVLQALKSASIFAKPNYLTPTCDCMGVIQPQVVPDIGIVGGRDIVAVEQASIDLVAKEDLILSKIPPYFKHLNVDKSKNLHPFQRLWGPMKDPGNVGRFGEKYNLGSSKYELVEILSPEETLHMEDSHSFERGQPSFS
jgi:uncharacterized Fe-S center protein